MTVISDSICFKRSSAFVASMPPPETHHGDDGTCADMCQRFGSQCVAALDNNPPGCTPSTQLAETPVKRRGRLKSVSVSGVDAQHPRGGERHWP